jgi:cytidylate kinase
MATKISITGALGSGKSTVCRQLLAGYGLKTFSTGAIQRGIAAGMGMSTLELNKYSETHPEIDRQIDGELEKLSDVDEDMVIDSRMAWHFVRNTFKVYLTADDTVAAERVFGDKRGAAEGYGDVNETLARLRARKESENARYLEKYGVDCGDLTNYDLILDTSEITPETAAELIMTQYRLWDKGRG